MAVPQTLSFEELQDILNVAAPTGISAPSITAAPPTLATPQTAGSSIAYINRPSLTQAYSPENLPEFMKDFEQISPTLFAPSQGVFGQAPEVDTIQPLMPQQYVDEYADLERAFQESIALDPTMFGDMYRSGLYMPVQTLPSAPEDEPFDLAESLAAAEALRQIYPYAKELMPEADMPDIAGAIDEAIVTPEPVKAIEDVVKAAPEFIEEKIITPAAETISGATSPILEAIDIAVDTPEPIKKIEDVAKAIPEKLDELVQTPETIKAFEDSAKSFLDTLPDTTTNLVGAYADVENMIENPSAENVDRAVKAVNDIGFDAGAAAPVVPPVVGEGLSVAADIDAIIDAFENPDAESLTNAYAAADGLAATYTEAGGLPAGEAIGNIGSILTGLEDLEGGIETPAEAVNVVNAANAVASMAGVTTTSATGATSAGFLPAGFGTFFAAASLVKPVMSALKGGAAGNYPRIQGEFNLEGGKFTVGGGVRAADTYRGVGDKFAQETMNSGVSMANSLVDDYGFEIDEQALNAAPENIMKLQTSGYYNREGRAQYGSAVGSEDFVVKLIQNGVLKPTENTPPEILTSNEAFASFITDHLDKGRDEYAAKMYDMTDGTGEEMIKMGGTKSRRIRNVTSRASFATQEAAQSWADDNFKETYGKKAVKIGRGYRDKPHRTTTSYSIVPVEAGDRTRYELKKTTSSERISDSEYAEATKPKPKPEPQLAYDPLDFLKGLDLSNIRLGPLF
jgi:hypothetical protein